MITRSETVEAVETWARQMDENDPDPAETLEAKLFATAWCAVGGERGGEVVPRWFGKLPELGVEQVHMLWAVPGGGEQALAALDGLRSASARWLAELQALGLSGDLSIKRGEPSAWLTALAEMTRDALIVVGPPAWRGGSSSTIEQLLEQPATTLLLLPHLAHPPAIPLLAHPVVDAGPEPDLHLPGGAAAWDARGMELLDLSALEPLSAVRTALRVAEDVDASLLVFPRRSASLVPLALQYGNFPLLVLPGGA